jgi:hypothetical protein
VAKRHVINRNPTREGNRFGRLAVASLAVILQSLLCASAARAQNFGEWEPAVSIDPVRDVGINTPGNDGCPIEASDGLTLFYATARAGNLDIWIASRDSRDADWKDPVPLPAPVNTLANDFCPTPLPGNGLLFVSTRGNTCGGAGNNPDIYYTRRDPHGVWAEPQALSCAVNSVGQEFSPSLVEAEGQTMLFFSSDQDDLAGHTHKIFVSVLQPDGTWQQAEPVAELNAPGSSDARPNVRKDGLEIVFDSTRDHLATGPLIYTATRSSVFDAWSQPTPLSGNVNFPGQAQSRPTISWDGTRLYFGSSLANSTLGGVASDIYVSTRSKPGQSQK